MRIISSKDQRAVRRLLSPSAEDDYITTTSVAAIVAAVRKKGDSALRQYTRRFDGLEGPLEVSAEEIEEGAAKVPRAVRRAIATAA